MLSQNVCNARQGGLRLRDLLLRTGKLRSCLTQLRPQLGDLCSGLHHTGLRFIHRRLLALENGLPLLEIRARNQAVFEELFAAFEVAIIPLKVRLCAGHSGFKRRNIVFAGTHGSFPRAHRSFAGGSIRFRRTERGFLRGHIGLGLRFVNAGQQLALHHVVAFLYQNGGELARVFGTDCNVSTRLHLTGRCDHARQVFFQNLAGLNRDDTLLAVLYAGENTARDQQYDNHAN